MGKKTIFFSLIILSVGLVVAALFPQKEIYIEQENLFLSHQFNKNYALAQRIDSLYLYGTTNEALEALKTLNETGALENNAYLKARWISLQSSIDHQKIPYSDILVLKTKSRNEAKTLFENIAIFDYFLFASPDSIDIKILKHELSTPQKWYPKVSLLNRIGQYYDLVGLDLDSTKHYYDLSAEVLKENKYLTREHFICYQALANLAPSLRRNLQGIRYSNLLCQFSSYLNPPDSLTRAYAYLTRANMLFREGDTLGSKYDNQLGLALIDTLVDVHAYQQFLKNEITFLENSPELRSKIDDILNLFEQSVNTSERDYFNLQQIKGKLMLYRNDYLLAIENLLPALEIELSKTWFNQKNFSTICFCLKDCYLKLELFEKSRYFIDFEDQNINGKNSSAEKKKQYSFMYDMERAKIHFQKYLVKASINDLYKAKSYIELVDQNMISQYQVADEQSILQFYLESGSEFMNLGLEVNYKLFELTKDTLYLNAYLKYSDMRKSSLMYRDMQLTNEEGKSEKVSEVAQTKIQAQINAEILKGIRGNNRFNVLVEKLTKLEKITQKEKGVLLTKQDLGGLDSFSLALIQNRIKPNELILDISQIDKEIYYLVIKNNKVLLSKKSLTNDENEVVNLSVIKMHNGESKSIEYDSLKAILIPQTILKEISDANSKSITVIPDGLFHRISLSLLLNEIQEVTYLPALKFSGIRNKSKDQNRDDNGNGIVIFSFSDVASISNAARTTMLELPGTYKEAKSLQKLYPKAKLFSGYSATKANFIQAYTNPSTHYIHLALHGIANSDKKEDVKLYFRTQNGGLDSLYGHELLQYKSQVDKIVLSACESASGKYIEGEGNYSLARYFLINGAGEVSSSVNLMMDNHWGDGYGMIRYSLK